MYGTPNVTTIVFDQELYPGFLASTNWTGRIDAFTQYNDTLEVVGKTAIWSSLPQNADPGPDLVSYDWATRDLRNRFGLLPAVSFTDFPVT